MKTIIGVLSLLCFNLAIAQEEDEAAIKQLQKQQQKAQGYTYQGNNKLQSNKFADAEADYRRAISTNPDTGTAKYNLGNAYYNRQSLAEAFDRFKQAVEVAPDKGSKHMAYHNMGNVFMKEKQFDKAVEAYKNALRNDPTDDETRYNLALAKQKKEEQDKQGGGGDDKNKDNKDQNQKDNKDQNKEGEKENEDKEGDKKDENKEGDGENDKKPEDPKDNEGDKKPEDQKDQKDKNKGGDQPKDKDKKPPKPRPGQLSPQQIKNLLQAMNNEEKKVQQKINAKKAKGAKVKNEKDW